jgi:energy-dependent translational throttle protein EttA
MPARSRWARRLAYVDQDRAARPGKSVWEVISGGRGHVQLGSREVNSRAYVGRFNFGGGDQQKKGKPSGGERNRVHLAKTAEGRRQRAAPGRADERP